MSKHLLEAAQRLADILTRENEALRRLDFPAATALVAAKEAALEALAKHPPSSELSQPLTALGDQLGRLAAENQAMLKRAIAVQTRILRIVARACAPPRTAPYAPPASRPLPHRTAALAISTRA